MLCVGFLLMFYCVELGREFEVPEVGLAMSVF